MAETFYRKVGRRYKPVSEYDQTLMDSFPKGSHLVVCVPGGRSTRFNIDPDYAAMIAAGVVAEDAVRTALVRAGEIRMQSKDRSRELTPAQKAAWDNLVNEFGDSARQLEWPSTAEVAEAGLKAMQAEAMKLMQHTAVREAYNHFLTMCELTRE
jgi:ribosomal protein S11